LRRLLRKSLLTLLILPLLAIPLLVGCANDPLPEIYTENLLSGSNDTYTVGSEDYPYSEGWFEELHLSGPTMLTGDGRVWIEFRPHLDFSSVRANGKPTHVTRGVFGGFSLPIYAADNEELYFNMCVPNRWSGPAWSYLGDVGDEPGQAGVYAGNLYIPSEATDEVYVYDGETFSLSGNVGDRPIMALAYGDNLYVTCYNDDNVWQFDGTTWSIASAVGNRPQGMAIFEGLLYVVCRNGAGIEGEMWRFDGTTWEKDPALGLGGAAGAIGNGAEWACAFNGDLFVSCGDVDDDIWVRNAGAWAKDDDVGNQPQVMHEHDGYLYVTSEGDDELWRTDGGGVWSVVTNIQTNTDGAPIGLEEYDGKLYAACFNSVWANISDFWNLNSDFVAITADQPMFFAVYDDKLYCICKTGDGIWVYEQETAYIHIHIWLASAQVNATDAFRLQIEYENFDAGVDIVPSTGDDIRVETLTGVVAQYQSYIMTLPMDMTGVLNDDNVGLLVQRIASSDEIAGEVIINHVGLIFLCDTLGNTTP